MLNLLTKKTVRLWHCESSCYALIRRRPTMTRIKISIGSVQIEYEGEPAFIAEGLIGLATQVFDLANQAGVRTEISGPSDYAPSASNENISTNTIAQILGVKTGSELALAAVAKIIVVNKKPLADRQSILDEMKEAVTFYKESYSSNLSSYIETLVKARRLNIVSRGTYGLANSEKGRLEQALAMGVA